MEPVSIILGLACMGCLALTVRGEDDDALFLALLLTLVWAGGYLLWWTDQLKFLALLDLIVGLAALQICRARRAGWTRVVLVMAGASLALDCAYAWSGAEPVVPFAHASNFVFVVQLAAVAGGGDVFVLLRGCVRRLRNSAVSARRKAPKR